MKVIKQSTESVLKELSTLESDWKDETSKLIIEKLSSVKVKDQYTYVDLEEIINCNSAKEFEVSLFTIGLFLGLSKDSLRTKLSSFLGRGGIGVKRYKTNKKQFLFALEKMGILSALSNSVNFKPVWSDILIERLRSGRGSAVQGQQRGRNLEDFTEEAIKGVFNTKYEARCTFSGVNGDAKCDFAIPNKEAPLILIEVKGYAATGSKMTDIIGDLDAIVAAKRNDATLLFVTDGESWNSRISDLRKIIQRQNQGDLARVYTMKMRASLIEDLSTLKREYGL